MATNREVAEGFVQGKEAHSANMRSTGTCLYSYNLRIACWTLDDGPMLDYGTRKGHTNTTQRHMRELEAALRQADRG